MKDAGLQRDAQRRADRIRGFREELAALESERAISLTEEQSRLLNEHLDRTLERLAREYDVDTTESQKRISWGMRIASTLGGAALCAALVLFFLRIWGSILLPVQVAILALTPILLLGATEYAARRERTLYYASLLGLLAVAAFVLDLSALGATFNIAPSRGALLAWGVFSLLVAYAWRIGLPQIAGVALLIGYTAACLAAWAGSYWADCMNRPENFLPGAALAFSVPFALRHRSAPFFPAVYRAIGLLTILLAILLLSMNGNMSYLPLGTDHLELGYQLAGLALSLAVVAAGVRFDWRETVNLGAMFFALFLYIRLFHWWWDWMPKYLFFLIFGLISLGLLVLFRRLRTRIAGRERS
jgi:uncharacterized membrane protein